MDKNKSCICLSFGIIFVLFLQIYRNGGHTLPKDEKVKSEAATSWGCQSGKRGTVHVC